MSTGSTSTINSSTTNTTTTYVFEMPNSPEELGVALPQPDLRTLDFSALDYQNMIRSAIEYIRTYYPNNFNDFFASNGMIMLAELTAYMCNVLSERSDILIDEAFLPTAQTENAVINHLALINQSIQRATPANVDVQITITSAVATEILIPAGLRFSFPGPDSQPVYYEIYRAPEDWTSNISIPAGKRGVIAFGIEGITSQPLVTSSSGGPSQYVDIPVDNVLDDPFFVTVTTGTTSVPWTRIPIIEKAGPQDLVYEVQHLQGKTRIQFGNDVAGKSPLAGQTISVTYRTGGGVRGRIAAGVLDEVRPISPNPPASALVEVQFTNPGPSLGGMDQESLDDARTRGPQQFATHNAAIAGDDYGLLASTYNHPVFGSVAKAIGTIRTGVEGDINVIAQQIRSAPTLQDAVDIMKTEYVNRNIVEVYVLAEGPGDIPILPSIGLKQGLVSFFSDINVLTDEIRILDGQILTVDVQATIVMSRNADAGTVKVAVQNAINNFFNINNFDMGTPLNLSTLYQVLQNIPGIKYVNIFEPSDNILLITPDFPLGRVGVAFNQVITLGNVDLKFYFEPGNFRTPTQGNTGGSSGVTA